MKKVILYFLVLGFLSTQMIFSQTYQVSISENPPDAIWTKHIMTQIGSSGIYEVDVPIHSVPSTNPAFKWFVEDVATSTVQWPIPGDGGAASWYVTNAAEQVVNFTYDVNTYSDGWIPASNFGNANDVIITGVGFNMHMDKDGAWFANGAMTNIGSGIYQYTKNIASIGTYTWYPKRENDSKFTWGTNGREMFTNNVRSITTTTPNQNVYLYLNVNTGRTFYTLDDPLPVELTTFSANIVDGKVNLNWATATEVNNYGFNVERQYQESSIKNQEWEKIAFVQGAGNSNSQKSYSYVDNSVADAGTYLYRLKQIDIDGSFEYSDVVEVNVLTSVEFELSQNYPNPFNPTTTIKFSLPETTQIKLTIFNAIGEQVTELLNKNMEAGHHSVEFNASKFNSGIYVYKLETGDLLLTRKMMLVK